MYPDWAVLAMLGVAVVFIWLVGLSVLVWQQNRFLKSLFPSSGSRDIRKKFEEILKAVNESGGELANLEKQIEAVKVKGLQHIQRVKLLRFNPYDDTGGNISFTACLLDKEGSGIVITSLHARSGTRVFGKEIIAGKSKQQGLSKEEEMVIRQAMEEKNE